MVADRKNHDVLDNYRYILVKRSQASRDTPRRNTGLVGSNRVGFRAVFKGVAVGLTVDPVNRRFVSKPFSSLSRFLDKSDQTMAPDTTTTFDNNTSTDLVKQASISSCAYVTFLAGDGDYWKGVVGLAKGLRKAESKYPLVVAILPDVPEHHRKILVSQGCILREIEPVHPPENQTQFAMAYYVINYSKLRIWEFVEYSKMIYLDGDIQVFDNVDHLFDMPDGYFYAVMDCFCEKTWSSSPQYKIGYCQQCPDKVKWPAEMGPKPPLYFNAGMFVYEPNLSTYHDLLKTLKVTPPTLFAEQDFLNMFFRDVYKPIPSDYNLVMAMLWRHPENINLDEVKVVHYCAAGSKPWRYTGKEENMDREDIKILVQKWWDIYNDESLDYKNPVVASSGSELQPILEALYEAGVGHYFTAPSAA
ncbi:hypothetical protein DKX38_027793 [Salix brachista]|uniref:Hexosyltransferase n=1 Tax=Salix brachista TaxID=2182728 RepID=A0A5N5JFT5_9ROSI|nr:hypothetical protein DKX38_027793 [Salix brachista]